MAKDKKSVGHHGEDLAVKHLRRQGYKIIQRNFRTPRGEIDIIAKHKGVLIFVEVKSRQSTRYGDPKWAITADKQRKISMVALEYLKRHAELQTSARFDVVTIQSSAQAPKIDVIVNAFELAYV